MEEAHGKQGRLMTRNNRGACENYSINAAKLTQNDAQNRPYQSIRASIHTRVRSWGRGRSAEASPPRQLLGWANFCHIKCMVFWAWLCMCWVLLVVMVRICVVLWMVVDDAEDIRHGLMSIFYAMVLSGFFLVQFVISGWILPDVRIEAVDCCDVTL